MAELKKQFDFSTLKDQEKFKNLTHEEREGIINTIREEAEKLKEMVIAGRASDYTDAERKLELMADELAPETKSSFKVRMATNGDVFLDLGGGEGFIGNTLEGAITEVDGTVEVDLEKNEENLKKILEVIDSFVVDAKGTA